MNELKLKPWKRAAIVGPIYNTESVQEVINRDPRISKRESKKIHQLLKGRSVK